MEASTNSNPKVLAHHEAVSCYKKQNCGKHNHWNALYYERNKDELKQKQRERYARVKQM